MAQRYNPAKRFAVYNTAKRLEPKADETATLAHSTPKNVRINIYNLDARLLRMITGVATFFSSIEGKVYHSGVEVCGVEWCYGYSPTENGIAGIIPKSSPLGQYSHSVEMGPTALDVDAIIRVLEEMRTEWKGVEYHVLKHNCHNFAAAFCNRLRIPADFPKDINVLAESAQASLGEGMVGWLFGDDEAAKFSVQDSDDRKIQRENLLETYAYMREVWEEWLEEEAQSGQGPSGTHGFVPGTVCHARLPVRDTFERDLRDTLIRLRRLRGGSTL